MSWRKFVIPKSALSHSTFVITDKGHIYGWGRNDDGQLGIGSFLDQRIPRRVLEEENLTWDDLIDMACGNYHTALLFKGGNLLLCGYNVYGQLGMEISSAGKSATFHEVKFFNNPRTSIVQVSCGIFHTAAVSVSGDIFTWGHNRHRQLGNGTTISSSAPVHVNIPAKIIRGYSGAHYQFAEADNGDFYAWGMNDDNLLGINFSEYPQKHETLSKISKDTYPNKLKDLVCGGYHFFAVTDNIVYGCGWNSYGQLGIETADRIKELTTVPTIDARNIKRLSAGGYFSIAITRDGKLIGAGSVKDIQLGLLAVNWEVSKGFRVLPEAEFGHKWISVVCAYSHAVGLTDQGVVYHWGNTHPNVNAGPEFVQLPGRVISLFGMRGQHKPPWELVRLLWIGKLKEEGRSPLSKLPKELVKYLTEFL